MIKVTNLNKYYNKKKSNEIHVINDTSIELPSTGLITFLGHSGSGKTTLLNVIGGLDKATGQIEYDDVIFNKYKASQIDKFRSRNIGYVFQNYNLLLTETVYDNLRIALELIGITNLEEQEKRIEYTLKAVGMFKYRKKLASNLSGGQQQRVSIARALIKKSKIIIADEPTGNLDSKNSIEVMNILKKLSEKALVLLVTHEEKLANFYSDTIFEIKDGKIIDIKQNLSGGTLDDDSSDTIYLKDLDKKEEKTQIGNITVYSDNSIDLNADISLIIKNGTIYLESNNQIKLVDKNIKIIDDHYKPIDKTHIEGFDYDTTWYNDTKDDKKHFKKFINRFRNSFISFRSVSKKQKFIYLCLAFIGFIMAIAFASLANGTTRDISGSNYSENVLILRPNNERISTVSVLKKAYEADEIENLEILDNSYITYTENVLYNYTIKVSERVLIAPVDTCTPALSCGSLPKNDNEVVVSQSFINKIKDKASKNENDMIGAEISLGSYSKDDGRLIISGISKNDNMMIYMKGDYLDLKNFYTDYGEYYKNEQRYYSRYYLRFKDKEQYQITAGRDIEGDYEILANDSHQLNEAIQIFDSYYTVVGIYSNEFADDNSLIIDGTNVRAASHDVNKLNKSSKLFKIIEGHYPTSSGQILASKYSNNIVGESVNVGDRTYQVVGIYDGVSELWNTYIVNSSDYTLAYGYYYNYITFNVKDQKAFNNRLKSSNCTLMNLKDYVQKSNVESAAEVLKAFVVVFVICLVASSLFVYFVMRSKMLSDIYSIGVYRSLGASRFRINRKYITDILVLTTFTCLLGYLFGTLGYYWFSFVINSVTYSLISGNILMVNNLYTFLGVLCIYAIMLIIGMLPIVLLQRKTPSEICSKYDI